MNNLPHVSEHSVDGFTTRVQTSGGKMAVASDHSPRMVKGFCKFAADFGMDPATLAARYFNRLLSSLVLDADVALDIIEDYVCSGEGSPD